MKTIERFAIVTALVLAAYSSEAQYFQRLYNFDYTPPNLRSEYLESGVCTRVNFSQSDSSKYFMVATGTSFAEYSPFTPDPDYNGNRVRYVRNNRAGGLLDNRGFEFRKSNNFLWYNSEAHSIDEVQSSNNNGGYVITGSVRYNPQTAGSPAGGSDVLFARLSSSGGVVDAVSIDHAGKSETGFCIKRSTAPDVAGTYLICGSVEISSMRTDAFVARVNVDGSVVWFKTFNMDSSVPFSPPTSFDIAYSLVEIPAEPDIIPSFWGEIHIVGTHQDATVGGLNGFWLRLDKMGNHITSVIYPSMFPGPGIDNVEFRSVKWSDDNNLLVTGSTTGLASGLTDGPHTLLVKLTPIIGGLLGTRILRAVNLGGFFTVPSVGRDLIERKDTAGAMEHYISGFAWDMGLFMPPFNIVFKADFIGFPVAQYLYTRAPFPFSNSIDFARNTVFAPGFALFSGAQNTTAPAISDSYNSKSYFNGVRCINNGITQLPFLSQLNLPGFSVLALDTSVGSTVTQLKAKSFNYQSFVICNQAAIAGGSNVREGEYETGLTQGELKVFPNPAADVLYVTGYTLYDKSVITIYNALGQKMQSHQLSTDNEQLTIDISSLAPGMYKVVLINQSDVSTGTFVKE